MTIKSHASRLLLALCLLGGTGLLSGCGSDPVTTTTERTTTTTTAADPTVAPPPGTSTTTVTHTQQTQ